LNRKQRLAVFQPEFIEDLRYRAETDRRLVLRTFDFIEAILKDPFEGIGKPESLKYLAPGSWSRRLTQEHRIVYLARDERIDFLQAKYHYYFRDDSSVNLDRLHHFNHDHDRSDAVFGLVDRACYV
jgi:toxin YoeB